MYNFVTFYLGFFSIYSVTFSSRNFSFFKIFLIGGRGDIMWEKNQTLMTLSQKWFKKLEFEHEEVLILMNYFTYIFPFYVCTREIYYF